MTAGLVQIVSYGNQDLYLTGTPEITYFKTIFRRYTNFAIENIEVQFDDEVNFDKISIVSIPTAGDLVHKMYLKLIIPSFYVQRNILSSSFIINKALAYSNYITALNDYLCVWKFMQLNIEAYRSSYEIYIATNTTGSTDIKNTVYSVFGNASRNISDPDPADVNVQILNEFIVVLGKYPTYNINTLSLDAIAYSFTFISPDPEGKSEKQKIFEALKSGKTISKYLIADVYTNYLQKKAIYDDYLLTNRKFAWVDKLGHSIINYIEIAIGGDVIDKHFGDWINIWYELTKNVHMTTIYNKMIGNVDTLTNYDRTTKPSYTLIIPLQFWFCRNNGMAIPLVSMQFMEITINLKLKKFSECSYIELEDDETSYALDDDYENQGLTINGSLLIDYIFLDEQERKKFAQSSHEYLIDQLQVFTEDDISNTNVQFDITFNEPCREIIWVLQRKSFITNTIGSTKCLWDNYTPNATGNGISLVSAHIELNGITIIEDINGEFYNYLIPYRNHTSTPSDGIYCYSFALKPEEQQPSGSCNFSRIKKSNLIVIIKNDMFLNNDTVIFRTYARNFNILRFASGMAGLAFV